MEIGVQVVRKIAVLPLLLLAGCITHMPEANVSPPRIALVGDSWPLIMRYHGGFTNALVEEGYRARQVRNVAVGWSYMGLTERRLAFQGIEAYRFVDESRLDALDELIERIPTIEIIHFTIGGADFLHDMPGGLPAHEQEAYFRAHVYDHVDAILTRLETSHPDKLIAFVGYDYLNFRDAIGTHKRTLARWERLKRPEPVELNEMMWRLTQLLQEVVAKHPGIAFIDVAGLTKERLGADPSIWEPPPREGMWKDGMHLSREGNAALARYCLEEFYWDRVMPLRDAKGRIIHPTGDLLRVNPGRDKLPKSVAIAR
jgi:lysophospholipase L1-like esterase